MHAVRAAVLVFTSIAQMRYAVTSVMMRPGVRYTALKLSVICRKSCCPFVVVSVNVAKAFAFGVFVRSIVQVVEVPEQSFDQPVNAEPVFGVAVSTTVVAVGYVTEQAAMQFTLPSLEVMVPDPVPDTPTVRVRSRSKVAVTLGFCEVLTVHLVGTSESTVQPLHPTKWEPATAVASSVIFSFPEYEVEIGRAHV